MSGKGESQSGGSASKSNEKNSDKIENIMKRSRSSDVESFKTFSKCVSSQHTLDSHKMENLEDSRRNDNEQKLSKFVPKKRGMLAKQDSATFDVNPNGGSPSFFNKRL